MIRPQLLLPSASVLILGCVRAAPAPSSAELSPRHAIEPGTGDLRVDCGRLIDGRGDEVYADVSVVIENGRITSVGNPGPTQVRVLDLSQYTCLPGLIDMHTHVMDRPEDNADLAGYFTMSERHVLEQGRRFAQVTLQAGFTTIRNLGTYYGWASRTLRDEIDRGQTPGPRMQIAGFYLTIPGGGGDMLLPDVPEAEVPDHVRMGVSRGASAFRASAQRAVDGGADVLKVIASGAVLSHGGVPGEPEMTSEEIEAVVQVAEAAGLRVAAHAHGAESIKQAIAAGVSTVEHASLIDPEGIALALEHGVALSMDIYDGDYIDVEGRRQGWPDEFLRKNRETTDAQRRGFTQAHAAGVPIVYGTDAFVYPHGDNGKQLAYMVRYGMTAMQAIQSATSVAARFMGWEDHVGSLSPGLFGDMIAVRGDPLLDISVLEHVDVVIKGGTVVKHDEHRGAPSPSL